ncbi:MAG: hypothetical protein HQL46_15635 [Gammaproteobacteria bacterium]|nr:hypothetical protein [Gammaproteobacteria bacterium]
MNQLTVRGFNQELSDFIHNESKKRGVSLNQVVIKLLEQAAGLSNSNKNNNTIGDSLDDLIANWTEEECSQFNQSISDIRQIDDELWK